MSSNYSESSDDYSSTEETEETESTEESDKKAAPTPPPKKTPETKQSSDSDDSDENSSDNSDQDDSYTESSSPEEPEKKEPQISQKSNPPKQEVEKKASPPNPKSSDESNSDYSESSYESDNSESSTPEKKASPPAQKPVEVTKEEPKKSPKAVVQAKKESESDYSESNEEPKKSPKPSATKDEEDSNSYYSESYSEKPKKEEPKKTSKVTTRNVKQDSYDESENADSKSTEQPPPKVAQKSAVSNSMDLDEPPNFAVPPEVLEEASHQKVDRYGWIQTKEPSSREKKILEEELNKEKERSKKWQKMMKKRKWPYYMTRKGFRVVKERTIKGIPNDIRPKAWILLLDPPDQRKPNRGSVQEFFDKGVPSVEHTIRVDIPRTMPNVPEFLKTETRQSLYRILRAYSNASGGGGYFQGMGFHAAIYLLYIKDEEKAFWCLYNLMQGEKHRVKDLYENEFAGLKVMNTVWEVLLEKKFKNVYNKLKSLGVDPMIYTPSWFLCAFLDLDFPPVLRLKIIDRFIVFGSRQLLSLALAIIDLNQEALSGSSAQMDTVLPLLQNPTNAKTMKDWREIVKKWDKHYMTKKEYSALFKKAGLKEIP